MLSFTQPVPCLSPTVSCDLCGTWHLVTIFTFNILTFNFRQCNSIKCSFFLEQLFKLKHRRLLIQLSPHSPIQTSPNCPAPSFFTILMDSLEISQASLSHGFWAFGFTQGRSRFRQSPSALSAGGSTVLRDYSPDEYINTPNIHKKSWKSVTIFIWGAVGPLSQFGTLWPLAIHIGIRF